MNFKQAAEKLEKIADGRYHSLSYDLTTLSEKFGKGRKEQNCKIYIDRLSWHCGTTWDDAFERLDKTMNPVEPTYMTTDDIDPVPEIERI